MYYENEWIETSKTPVGMIERKCQICEKSFYLCNDWDGRLICPQCQETLKMLIEKERRNKDDKE